jgi:phage major tail protein, phi13 family
MSTTVVGVEELFFAVIEDETQSLTEYDTPERLGYVQELTITPNSEAVNQYGDNRIIESYTSISAIEVNATLTGISPEVEATILGYTHANGVTIKHEKDQAPFVALMYKRLMANGKYRYKVLYKGKFSLPEESNQTKEESVTFQSTSLVATFVPRLDGIYEYQVDEGTATGPALASIETWFTSVQEPVNVPASSPVVEEKTKETKLAK